MGGRGFADVDNGSTTTVPLALFKALTVKMTAGRHFWISIPSEARRTAYCKAPDQNVIHDAAISNSALESLTLQYYLNERRKLNITPGGDRNYKERDDLYTRMVGAQQ